VLVRFPFSDLSASKLRPALVLASAGREDWILCQITGNSYADPMAIGISDNDFETGSLQRVSYVRPGKLFTANRSLMQAEVGRLSAPTFRNIIAAIIDIFRRASAIP